MARRRRTADPDALIRSIDGQLQRFQEDCSGLTLREKVLRLVAIRRSVGDLGVSVAVEHGFSRTSARDRIKAYLLTNVGIVVCGEELAVVSGISEYARRVRELRVEHGLRVLTGNTSDEDSGLQLRPDDYLLVSCAPDTDAARRWAIANRIRRSRAGSRERVLEFLRENVGRVVTTEDLAYVARGATEFARRVRELRTEEGFAIATRFTGRPDLGMGEYVLLSLDRVAEPHDRHVPMDVQRAVYQRDENKCRVCGWSMSDWSESDPRFLELHHVRPHANRGQNIANNLIVICSKCHDNVHAGRIQVPDLST
jgi:hypothetical protein